MNYKRILVFGAHPDDEQTMANAMAKMADMGVEVYVAIMTDGSEGYPEPWMKDTIVEMRIKEGEESDRVIGVKERIRLGRPDMGLVNDKETFKAVMAVVRKVRPDAVFTHGPHDRNRDHTATHMLTMEAVWQGGEPVSAELGEPWTTPHLFYYKGIRDRDPDIVYDTTGYAHKFLESRATQVSQHTLFNMTIEDYEKKIADIKAANPHSADNFWLTGKTPLRNFPDIN